MKIPEGMTEQEVLAVMENVAKRLANKFKFGYHEADDMKQEAKIAAIEAMDGYDTERPLENFLYAAVHNKLFNMKRNKFERLDKPCHKCPFFDPKYLNSDNQCSAFGDRNECVPFAKWSKRNEAKKNLMKPIDLGNVQDEHERNMRTQDSILDDLCDVEMMDLIDKYLPIELREDFVKLKHQFKIPKARRLKVEEAVLEILQEHFDGA